MQKNTIKILISPLNFKQKSIQEATKYLLPAYLTYAFEGKFGSIEQNSLNRLESFDFGEVYFKACFDVMREALIRSLSKQGLVTQQIHPKDITFETLKKVVNKSSDAFQKEKHETEQNLKEIFQKYAHHAYDKDKGIVKIIRPIAYEVLEKNNQQLIENFALNNLISKVITRLVQLDNDQYDLKLKQFWEDKIRDNIKSRIESQLSNFGQDGKSFVFFGGGTDPNLDIGGVGINNGKLLAAEAILDLAKLQPNITAIGICGFHQAIGYRLAQLATLGKADVNVVCQNEYLHKSQVEKYNEHFAQLKNLGKHHKHCGDMYINKQRSVLPEYGFDTQTIRGKVCEHNQFIRSNIKNIKNAINQNSRFKDGVYFFNFNLPPHPELHKGIITDPIRKYRFCTVYESEISHYCLIIHDGKIIVSTTQHHFDYDLDGIERFEAINNIVSQYNNKMINAEVFLQEYQAIFDHKDISNNQLKNSFQLNRMNDNNINYTKNKLSFLSPSQHTRPSKLRVELGQSLAVG